MSEAAVVSSAARKADRLVALAIVLVLGSHLPLLIVHFQNLWRWKPHYQCFPLLLLGIGGLIWQRRPRTSLAALRPRLANPLLLLGLAVLTASVLVSSPWLAAVAFVLSAGGVMLGLGAARAWRDWLPVWVLMWLLVPPPVGWDDNLVRGLQSMASRGCSPVLDVLGVRHLVEGNVVVLPGHRLLVAEACSGVNSLFTLLIATALFVVVVRRPLVWSVLLLASSVGWAGLMNMVRLVTVAVVQAWCGVDISSGWQHEALGFATVGLALVMIACTDRLLAFLLGPIERRAGPVASLEDPIESRETEVPNAGPPLKPLSRAWNWCTGNSDSHAAATSNEVPCGQPAPNVGEITTRVGGVNWGIVASFVVLACVQLSGSIYAAFSGQARESRANLLASADLFRREDLPKVIGDWRQIEYNPTNSQSTRDVGAFSHIWVYELDNGCRCTVSADYPFGGWHDLSVCYVAIGWEVVNRAVRQPKTESSPAPDPYLEIHMVKPEGERSLLLFSLISPAGGGIDIPEQSTRTRVANRFAGNPLSRWLSKNMLVAGRETALQVQAFVASNDPLPATEQEAVHKLFAAVRTKLASAYASKQASGRP